MKYSILTSDSGANCKIVNLDEHDNLTKIYPAPFHSGTAEHCENNLSELKEVIHNLCNNQCFVHGIVKGSDVGDIHTIGTTKTADGEVKARTKENFIYDDSPHLGMFDNDQDSQCPRSNIEPDQLLPILSEIDPQFDTLGNLVVRSSSDGLSVDGKPLHGGGYHMYFQAETPSGLAAYMEALFKNTVINNYGWIKLSRTGAMLVRSICFDSFVFSPERIDFTTAPEIKSERITQNRAVPVFTDGTILNCATPPAFDTTEYDKVVRELKSDPALIKEAAALRKKYITDKSTVLAKQQSIDIALARKIIISSIDTSDLQSDFMLEFRDFGLASVADACADPTKYDQQACCDPLEPEEGSNKALFFANLEDGGKSVVNSMLHGGKKFFLHPIPQTTVEIIEQLDISELSSTAQTEKLKELIVNADVRDPATWSFIRAALKKKFKVNLPAIDSIAGSVTAQNSSGNRYDYDSAHACVMVGSKFRILKETIDPVLRRRDVQFLTKKDFEDFYSPYNPGSWLDNRNRRTYDRVVFNPSGNVGNAYNLFSGFLVNPVKGNCNLFLQHVHQVICDGDDEHYAYLIMWLARCVQDPGGKRPGVAVVLRGAKGTGKGAFMKWLEHLFGQYYLHMSSSGELVGKFNNALATALMIFADEAVFAGDKSTEGRLKTLITESLLTFEKKGIDSQQMKSFLNILMASNSDYVVPATPGTT